MKWSNQKALEIGSALNPSMPPSGGKMDVYKHQIA
jgi:hypothetical protein